jgi:hypothetical protein
MTSLPDLPSALIVVALADLAKVEADPRYAVNMSWWHRPKDKSRRCVVCLAGAVMAKTLGSDPTKYLAPYSFDRDVAQKLNALDAFRVGGESVFLGLATMSSIVPTRDVINRVLADPSSFDHLLVSVPAYAKDPLGFVAAMTLLASRLREIGL